MKMHLLSLVVLAVVVAILGGCGGGDSVAPITPPANTPAVHDGFTAVAICDGQLLAQDNADHWSGGAGVYTFAAIRADEIGTMAVGVDTCGGINMAIAVTRNGRAVKSTTGGWILGVGAYNVTIPNPAGGTITATLEVSPLVIESRTVRMVAMNAAGEPFAKDDDGFYTIPVGMPFRLVAVWTDESGNLSSAPSGVHVYDSALEYSQIEWLSGDMMKAKWSGDNWAQVYISPSEMGLSVTADVTYLRFTLPGYAEPPSLG